MQYVFSTKGKITPIRSLPGSVGAVLTARGKAVSRCTVTKDPTLQCFTYTKGR